ncbi:MAG: UDP-N-acetylmuramoyl-L-alanine--D-glutamate ligase [Anditalea sp.]
MKKITILGAGESGIGAALLAKVKGNKVFVSDAGIISASRKAQLEENEIDYEEGQHTLEKILSGEEVVKSPGIGFDKEVVQQIMENGIPVIDELEFARRYSKGKTIAITGTNGKTTTTLLTYHLLKTADMDVGLAGNVGKSWAAQLVEGDHEWWVLEVSSFQIDGFKDFKPNIAVVINITPDHLDRYGYSLDKYIHAKLNLLKKMNEEDHLIYFREDENIRKGLGELGIKPKVHEISLNKMIGNGGYYDQRKVRVNFEKGVFIAAKEEIALTGAHNMINVMCALNVALIAGADENLLRKGLRNFKNAPHRMERVEEIGGVLFINDSKGTNVDATAFALSAFKEPLIWIAGGVDKGNDYTQLYPLMKDHVKMLICLGKNNEKLKEAFGESLDEIIETQDIKQAVKQAQEKGVDGDVVLFSPACASFDLFRNYEDRGDQFKEAVRNLKNKG